MLRDGRAEKDEGWEAVLLLYLIVLLSTSRPSSPLSMTPLCCRNFCIIFIA